MFEHIDPENYTKKLNHLLVSNLVKSAIEASPELSSAVLKPLKAVGDNPQVLEKVTDRVLVEIHKELRDAKVALPIFTYSDHLVNISITHRSDGQHFQINLDPEITAERALTHLNTLIKAKYGVDAFGEFCIQLTKDGHLAASDSVSADEFRRYRGLDPVRESTSISIVLTEDLHKFSGLRSRSNLFDKLNLDPVDDVFLALVCAAYRVQYGFPSYLDDDIIYEGKLSDHGDLLAGQEVMSSSNCGPIDQRTGCFRIYQGMQTYEDKNQARIFGTPRN